MALPRQSLANITIEFFVNFLSGTHNGGWTRTLDLELMRQRFYRCATAHDPNLQSQDFEGVRFSTVVLLPLALLNKCLVDQMVWRQKSRRYNEAKLFTK